MTDQDQSTGKKIIPLSEYISIYKYREDNLNNLDPDSNYINTAKSELNNIKKEIVTYSEDYIKQGIMSNSTITIMATLHALDTIDLTGSAIKVLFENIKHNFPTYYSSVQSLSNNLQVLIPDFTHKEEEIPAKTELPSDEVTLPDVDETENNSDFLTPDIDVSGKTDKIEPDEL